MTEKGPDHQSAERLFRFTAEAEFSAADIDDAFLKLAAHFSALANGEDSDLLQGGHMKIRPYQTDSQGGSGEQTHDLTGCLADACFNERGTETFNRAIADSLAR